MSTASILVSGDFVLDHHIYEGQRHHYGGSPESGVRMIPQVGGAALVYDLLRELVEPPEAVHLSVCNDSHADVPGSECAYAFWRAFPKKAPEGKRFWRVSEAMGFGSADAKRDCTRWPKVNETGGKPEIVVLSEGGMGFRDNPHCWPKKAQLAGAKWIVNKTASPMAEGRLWEELSSRYRQKLIVIVSAGELRKSQARLHAGLSWEETLEGVLRELRKGGALHSVTQCRHLVIVFESEGALWLDLGKSGNVSSWWAQFVYDAAAIEGDHAQNVEGTAYGFLSCMAAAVAWQLSDHPADPDFAAAMEGGLAAMRDLREKGHGPAGETPAGFPAARLAGVIKHPGFPCSRAEFAPPPGNHTPPPWTLLREAVRGDGPAFDLARLVVLRGPVALQNLPHLSIGGFTTVDRAEIESLRTLTQVIRRYQDKNNKGKKPLSIGVFGPPGAGKSFAVKELSINLVGKDGWLEFNLSQFKDPEDLIGAFHQIRDKVLQGLLPVAFFDEFDSQRYKWLQYLLAPMQDGHFQEGQVTHTIGKCIFIFAGGTSWSFETFGPPAAKAGDDHELKTAVTEFRLSKGPDFKSRIDAFLNVMGPNRRPVSPPPKGTPKKKISAVSGHSFGPDPHDACFPVRRALMIRSEMKCGEEDKLNMDEGVLHALLRVESFTHGARSLGKVLQPFAAAKNSVLHRSLLMSRGQLAMHTDADEFLKLCAAAPKPFTLLNKLTSAGLDAMAESTHAYWRELGKKEKWLDPKMDKPFRDLDRFFQESNREAVRRMLRVLPLADLKLVKGIPINNEDEDVRRHIEFHIELLAEAEHAGWMDWHLAQGWRFAEKRNNDKKEHPCLRPYLKLKHAEQEKDRSSIRHYLDIACAAGSKIVFAR